LKNQNIILETGILAAKSSAELILNALKKPKFIDYKGTANLVTQTDSESEQNIKSIISNTFPDHGILAEETGISRSNSPYLWVVDPLDGTTNFTHEYPSFSVSIGVLYHNIPMIGIVYELPCKKLYFAIKNKGAYCNELPISVSETYELSKSLLVTGFGYDHDENWNNNMKLFKQFTDITQGVRRLGAASVDLCHVASGIVDGFWEFDLKPWDMTAGMIIVKEAGGTISKMKGEPFSIYDDQIIASNGKIHSQMVKEIGETIYSQLDNLNNY